jgi:hypothetical protein
MEIEPTNRLADFQEIVSESRAKIAESQNSTEVKLRPKTTATGRPVGRPRKHPRPTENVSVSGDGPALSPAVEPKNDYTNLIKIPLVHFSKYPAVKYQIPELQVTDDEATQCARALNDIANAFVPDVEKMDPKTAAVVQGLAVFGSIGFQKYLIFQESQKQKAPPPAPKNPDEFPPPPADQIKNQIKNGVEPDQYFKTLRV